MPDVHIHISFGPEGASVSAGEVGAQAALPQPQALHTLSGLEAPASAAPVPMPFEQLIVGIEASAPQPAGAPSSTGMNGATAPRPTELTLEVPGAAPPPVSIEEIAAAAGVDASAPLRPVPLEALGEPAAATNPPDPPPPPRSKRPRRGGTAADS